MRRTSVLLFVAGVLVACAPSPSPTNFPLATPSPQTSPPSAGLACQEAAQQLSAARQLLLAEIAAPPTGIDPGFARSPIYEHLAVGVRVLRADEACFREQTTAAWRAANALLNNPPAGGIDADTLRDIFDALPIEPIG